MSQSGLRHKDVTKMRIERAPEDEPLLTRRRRVQKSSACESFRVNYPEEGVELHNIAKGMEVDVEIWPNGLFITPADE